MVLALDEARARWGEALDAQLTLATAGDDLIARMVAYHLGTGGKRLRGLLPAWIAANLGGRGEDALALGAGLELLHNATLVHDDVQDGDPVRRGQPTVWRRWGVAQAINAGDALYFTAMRVMLVAPAGPALMAATAAAMGRVILGQAMEFQLQRPPEAPEAMAPSLAAWERMARGKTGALIGLCFRAGAATALADEATTEALAAWGEELGLLFQIQDDYLDLVGDKGRDLRGSDLAEGKLSFPVVWALDHAPAAARERLEAILRRPRAETSAENVAEGLALLEGAGALEATAQRLRDMRDAAAAHPLSHVVPGLAERFLAPVAHAL